MAILTKAAISGCAFKLRLKSSPTFLFPMLHYRSREFSSSRFPSQSQYRKQLSLANLFQRYGFPPSQLPDFLSRNHSLLNNFVLHEIEKSLGILSSWKVHPELMFSVVYECPGVLELEFLEKWERVFSGGELSGVSSTGIVNVVKLARRLDIVPDRLLRNVEFFKGSGFGDGVVRRILEGFPRVITLKENEISEKIHFLKRIGIPIRAIGRVLYGFPGILGCKVENRLKPLYFEFRNLGFSEDLIVEEIIREPNVLSMELGEFSRCMELLQSLKCREAIRMQIFREGPFRAASEVKLRVDCLCRHGLIRREAFKVLWKEPRVIVYGAEETKKKIEFLVHRMKYGIECLVDVPEYLGVNFEKQIIPRYNVIEYLNSRGGLGNPIQLKDLIKPSRLRFYNLYVKPYPEYEKIYGRYAGEEVRKRYSVGLWKLFKPQKYPESRDDVKNIKSFMESLY